MEARDRNHRFQRLPHAMRPHSVLSSKDWTPLSVNDAPLEYTNALLAVAGRTGKGDLPFQAQMTQALAVRSVPACFNLPP